MRFMHQLAHGYPALPGSSLYDSNYHKLVLMYRYQWDFVIITN